MYPIKSFTVPNKTCNKVSMQHFYIVGTLHSPPPFPLKLSPTPLVACIATPNGDFKASPHLFAPSNPKSRKYDKNDKATYIVSSHQ